MGGGGDSGPSSAAKKTGTGAVVQELDILHGRMMLLAALKARLCLDCSCRHILIPHKMGSRRLRARSSNFWIRRSLGAQFKIPGSSVKLGLCRPATGRGPHVAVDTSLRASETCPAASKDLERGSIGTAQGLNSSPLRTAWLCIWVRMWGCMLPCCKEDFLELGEFGKDPESLRGPV